MTCETCSVVSGVLCAVLEPYRALQIHRSFRKPLIIFTPKNLLRHPKAKSKLLEFDDQADDPNILGVRFKRLIMDNDETDRSPNPPPRPDVKRLVLCSGKIYYELEAAREEAGQVGQIAICRVEQLAPFPFDLVMRELKRYPNAQV
jgi:2-oxoglutarate dehydrogenase E1 component